MSKRERLTALLIEDSAADILFVSQAFARTRIDFIYAKDGVAGLMKARAEMPDVIFLDINMPRMRGDEVLRALKANPATRGIPVVILTTSTNPDDELSCWDLQCANYINKPLSIEKFERLAQIQDELWLDFSRLPERAP